MNKIIGREAYNTVINMTTTKSQKNNLENLSKKYGISKSEIIRHIIDDYLNNEEYFIKSLFNKNKVDDGVILSYNLLKCINSILANTNLDEIDKYLRLQIGSICNKLEDYIRKELDINNEKSYYRKLIKNLFNEQ